MPRYTRKSLTNPASKGSGVALEGRGKHNTPLNISTSNPFFPEIRKFAYVCLQRQLMILFHLMRALMNQIVLPMYEKFSSLVYRDTKPRKIIQDPVQPGLRNTMTDILTIF